MLRGVSDYLIAIIDLLEAEGRSAKKNVWGLVTAIAVYMLGTLLLAGAAGFLVTGLYLGLSTVLHPAWVTTICGTVLLVAGVIVLWTARARAD